MNESCGEGRFVRDGRGIWRYGAGGQPVSGAQDMTLTNLFNFAIQERETGPFVEVQRGLAIENDALSWCLEHDDEAGSTIDVPYEVWQSHDRVIGVWAPELKEEGGIRGLRFDSPHEASGPNGVRHAPVAPTKRPDLRRMFTGLERDLRRKGWIPQMTADGTTAYWSWPEGEKPLSKFLKNYGSKTPEHTPAEEPSDAGH